MKLPSTYEPQTYESDIYELWEQSGAFRPKGQGSGFSIAMPPPNANGNLHIGHALTNAIQDVLIRYNRMKGSPTVYLPGADHAGFETWVVYEKQLQKEGKSRFDFSREELYQGVWDFVQLNKGNFESQLRALGASCDWDNFTFTLDERVVKQSYKTFKKLWDEGLIYRGERIVNYCTHHGTSFSDIEVVHETEKTKLWHIAYPLADGSGEVVIATTRPETKLGQSALMVNPNDKRNKHLIGKIVNQPLIPDVPIKIIADDYVNPEFGTGVVTVTPGHDTNDFEVARRHNLPIIELINHEGKMSQNVPEQFRGMTVLEARTAVAKALEDGGFIRKVEDYEHSVGKCYRCGTVIEPLVKDQWFLSMRPLADKAIERIEQGKINFYPASKKKQTVEYLKSVHDWNISRQIAWGIPIPAFVNIDNPDEWIFDERVDQEQIVVDGKTYRRDPDVFDTWFSSGHWPLVTTGYPDNHDLKNFYPLNLMETGGEILYQWVARMIMLGIYLTDEVPFKDVYIHGYVMAEDGSKMSKSLGNVINPVDVINEYGSDALRIGILDGRVAGINRGYDSRKVKEARNFCNKLWNIARFIEDRVGDEYQLKNSPDPKTPADHWILYKLQQASSAISDDLEKYRISDAVSKLYHFVWDDFADWYIESSKVQFNPSVLTFVLDNTLKLAHPFAPFVSETIWQTLSWEPDDSLLINQRWPNVPSPSTEKVEDFSSIMDVVLEARHIISSIQLGRKPNLYFKSAPFIEQNAELFKHLAKIENVMQVSDGRGLHLTKSRHDCWLDIDQSSASHYLAKLEAQRAETHNLVSRLEERLSNKNYLKNAPKEVVGQTKQQLDEEKQKLDHTIAEIASFRDATKSI